MHDKCPLTEDLPIQLQETLRSTHRYVSTKSLQVGHPALPNMLLSILGVITALSASAMDNFEVFVAP